MYDGGPTTLVMRSCLIHRIGAKTKYIFNFALSWTSTIITSFFQVREGCPMHRQNDIPDTLCTRQMSPWHKEEVWIKVLTLKRVSHDTLRRLYKVPWISLCNCLERACRQRKKNRRHFQGNHYSQTKPNLPCSHKGEDKLNVDSTV